MTDEHDLRVAVLKAVRGRYTNWAEEMPEALRAALADYDAAKKASKKASKSKTREEPQATGFDRQEGAAEGD